MLNNTRIPSGKSAGARREPVSGPASTAARRPRSTPGRTRNQLRRVPRLLGGLRHIDEWVAHGTHEFGRTTGAFDEASRGACRDGAVTPVALRARFRQWAGGNQDGFAGTGMGVAGGGLAAGLAIEVNHPGINAE